jgi:hypothetical protein
MRRRTLGEVGQQRGQIAVSRTRHLAVIAQHPSGFAGQPGQLTVGQYYGTTFEAHSRECRLCVVVGHEI